MAKKCVHKGCGKTYENDDEDCVYHPDGPEFHEGQKGWKCCKPRVLVSVLFESRVAQILTCSDFRRVPRNPTLHDRQTLRRRRHACARARQGPRGRQWHAGQPWIARGVSAPACPTAASCTGRTEAISLTSAAARVRRRRPEYRAQGGYDLPEEDMWSYTQGRG